MKTQQAQDPIRIAVRNYSEILFEEAFKANMKGGTIQRFRKDYPTLHGKVIIPLIENILLQKESQIMNQAAQIDLLNMKIKDLQDQLKSVTK